MRDIFMKIVFTGGGTAGHAMVNKVLISYLDTEEMTPIYIGSFHGAEKNMIESQGIARYFGISTGKLRRYFSLTNVSDAFRVFKGIYDAYKILKREQPRVVFSGGGFVTVPVVLAAHILKIPILIRETDMTVGLANKISMRFASKVFTTFEDTQLALAHMCSEYGGLIVRPDLLTAASAPHKSLTFDNNKPVLLIMGGSLGSECINTFVQNNLEPLLKSYNVVHISGKNKVHPLTDFNTQYYQYDYIENIGNLYAIADVIVSRCGSNAISECIALGKRTVCIPLPSSSSRGEQTQNANYARKNGCAVLLDEKNLTLKNLLESIESVLLLPIKEDRLLSPIKLESNCKKHIEAIREFN